MGRCSRRGSRGDRGRPKGFDSQRPRGIVDAVDSRNAVFPASLERDHFCGDFKDGEAAIASDHGAANGLCDCVFPGRGSSAAR